MRTSTKSGRGMPRLTMCFGLGFTLLPSQVAIKNMFAQKPLCSRQILTNFTILVADRVS